MQLSNAEHILLLSAICCCIAAWAVEGRAHALFCSRKPPHETFLHSLQLFVSASRKLAGTQTASGKPATSVFVGVPIKRGVSTARSRQWQQQHRAGGSHGTTQVAAAAGSKMELLQKFHTVTNPKQRC